MRWRQALVLAFALFDSAAGAAGLPRIVSMNVCSDQLLLSLADPGQILGLSRFSRDAWQSFAADQARRFPILSGGAEDVLEAKPDIVVASLFDKRSTRELLKANGLNLVEFTVPRTLDEVKQQIRDMGEVVQHPDRAAAAIARLDARDRPRAPGCDRSPLPRAAAVAPRLGVGQRVARQFAADGNRPAQSAANLGLATGGFASLEAIVQLKPDFLLVADAGDRAEDDGRAFLLHPVLARLYPPDKRIVLPERLTVCGGVMLADALDALTAELQRVAR